MFYIFNWTSWKKWAAVLSVLLLFFISYRVSAVYIFENATTSNLGEGAITKSLKDKQEIALTFNVPWGDDVLIDLLDVLDENQVKATFFVNGQWALRNEDLAELIVNENHEVGLLGFSDEAYEGKSFDYIKEDLEQGETVLKNLDYSPLQYVRVPENRYSETITEQIYKLGYRTVFWSIFADIDQTKDSEAISQQIQAEAGNGDIIVMPVQDDLTKSPEVIELFIEQKEQDGYEFVTITELLSPAQMEINPIE